VPQASAVEANPNLAAPAAVGSTSAPAFGAPEGEHQSAGGLWPLFALGVVLVIACGAVAVLRQRSRRRAAQDRALLESSVLSDFPPAPPVESPVGAALVEPPAASARVAAVVADDRSARSGRPVSAPPSTPPGSLPPLSERQWQSQRPPRSHKDPS
jgi:hypothetical protein